MNRKLNGLTLGLLIAFVVVAIISAVLAYNVVLNLVKGWKMTDLPGAPQAGTAAAIKTPVMPKGATAVAPLQASNGPTPQPWDGKSRVTILVMGLDYRDWETGETPRSDTMILLTIDPISNTIGMLSIPRDMWVNIPGFDYNKINTAYFLGETWKLPGGGPGLAVKTVESFLGVPVQFYAQVDFKAFVQFIDEIKGVKLDIKEPITIDPVGQGNTITLQTGRVTLDGQLALAYARNRYTAGNDFDRSDRQMQVIMAVRDRILEFNMLPTLITRSPVIYQEISSGVKTNLNLTQVIQLGLLAARIPRENFHRAVIGTGEVQISKSSTGLDILIPIPDKVRLKRDEIFSTSGPVGPAAAATSSLPVDIVALMQQEKARISVQNGSQMTGLATRTSDLFKSNGLNVVELINADQIYENTTILVYSGKPYTLNYLAKLLNNVPSGRIFNRFTPDTKIDLVVILGKDWANKNTLPK